MSEQVAPPSAAHTTKSTMSAVNEKLGPLPVWAWGAIATAGFFAYTWWHNRTTTPTTTVPTPPTNPNPNPPAQGRTGGQTGGKKGKDTGLGGQQPPQGGQLQQLQSAQENLPAIPVGSGARQAVLSYVVPPASQRQFDPAEQRDSDYLANHESGRLAVNNYLVPESDFTSAVGGSDTFLSGARYEYIN